MVYCFQDVGTGRRFGLVNKESTRKIVPKMSDFWVRHAVRVGGEPPRFDL